MITFFSRSAMPSNLVTVPEWKTFSRHVYKGVNFRTAARRYAADRGGALVMLADDTMEVYTLRDEGVRKKSFKPGTWRWAD